MPNKPPGDSQWPRITIVTPSYNQGQFIEETIRSVLLQGYPNLEYIIIDGGSTDNSAEIIRKYEPWLAYWVSEPDQGQTHAINKGFSRASGDILAWLNSDDFYYPHTLHTIANTFSLQKDAGLIYGTAAIVNKDGQELSIYPTRQIRPDVWRMQYWKHWPVPQPAAFVSRTAYDDLGGLDESFNFSLDYEWFNRIADKYSAYYIDKTLATYRIHSDSKTSTQWEDTKHSFYRECLKANVKLAPPWYPHNWKFWLVWARDTVVAMN